MGKLKTLQMLTSGNTSVDPSETINSIGSLSVLISQIEKCSKNNEVILKRIAVLLSGMDFERLNKEIEDYPGLISPYVTDLFTERRGEIVRSIIISNEEDIPDWFLNAFKKSHFYMIKDTFLEKAEEIKEKLKI